MRGAGAGPAIGHHHPRLGVRRRGARLCPGAVASQPRLCPGQDRERRLHPLPMRRAEIRQRVVVQAHTAARPPGGRRRAARTVRRAPPTPRSVAYSHRATRISGPAAGRPWRSSTERRRPCSAARSSPVTKRQTGRASCSGAGKRRGRAVPGPGPALGMRSRGAAFGRVPAFRQGGGAPGLVCLVRRRPRGAAASSRGGGSGRCIRSGCAGGSPGARARPARTRRRGRSR